MEGKRLEVGTRLLLLARLDSLWFGRSALGESWFCVQLLQMRPDGVTRKKVRELVLSVPEMPAETDLIGFEEDADE